MARSLRELRHGALSIAQYGLPQAVARLRDPQLSAQMSPVQAANQIAEPLPVRSKDEFGQVTEAFNAVHLEAVRTAAEQAALRSSVATMFVNLARRSQILVDRLIGHLDRLERGEEDPDRLAELFQLDHLATRMRRNDENLLVLAGADSTRVQRESAALIDVLRAAQSEVEHYTRIEFGVIDRDIEVAAHAVNDMVHLVAELFDNATSFSPPDSQVLVEARRVGDRSALYVEDRGIGISPDQLHDLNERLATPPQVDVAVSRMMGLVVVARLASRHGVRVELRPGGERGTVAEVTLPTAVLVARALSGRVQQPGGFETLVPQSPVPAQRPAFGAPLALESGPAAARHDERTTQSGPGGRSFDPMPINGGLLKPPSSSRAMPAWSDLTGATGANGDAFTPRPSSGQSADPLPQRRATDQWTVDGEVTGSGPLPNSPRQDPGSRESRPSGAGFPAPSPVSGLPMGLTPPVSSPPVPPISAPPVPSAPPVSSPPLAPAPRPTVPTAAPPVWPPVATPERDAATPPVPEKLAAALDMTRELPQVTRSTAATPVSAPPPAESRLRFADETMELPIFRELESAWFRTRRSTPEEPTSSLSQGLDPAASARTPYATVDAGRGAGQNTSTGATGSTAMVNTPMSAGRSREAGPGVNSAGVAAGDGNGEPRRGTAPVGWESPADVGWRAATEASESQVTETTQTGLPKRVPMAQLVPGGVDKPSGSVRRRTPEAVRGLLSAYHRGVQRGRTHPKDDHSTSQGSTPNGPQSQAGSGPAAGNGQKE
jgi:signal transduction histidine kinase